LTGDPYYTDGLRVVIFLASEPVPIEQVDFINCRNWIRQLLVGLNLAKGHFPTK
jgi:hypothetical protein